MSYQILKDLVKFNTIKDKENKEILDYIENYLLKLNFKTELKGKNLVMSIGKSPKLGFLGHTDTVEYIDGWNTNPFELTNIDGNLYGLGACDMKGGIAAMLESVSKVDLNKLQYGIKLYFTYDEEIDFGGIYDLVNSKEEFPDVMIFGEPTYNETYVGHKGILEFELMFNGIKAHSSNPEKGKSANLNAVKFIYDLQEFYESKIKVFKEIDFEIPYTTMNVGIINGGSAKNSIPAFCNVLMDFRIVNKKHIIMIKKYIELLSKKYDCNVKVLECVDPFINKTKLVKEIKTGNFMTEASFINEKCTRLILGTGPVTAHEVNEYITESSYNNLVKQYKELIEKVCN